MAERAIEHSPVAEAKTASPRWADRAVEALPLTVLFGLAAFIVERDGGFAQTVWYPVGLIVLAFVVTLALSARRQFGGLPSAAVGAIVSIGAFTLWCFATIAWAAVRGDAWDGSNEALLYLLVFALLASWRASAGALWPLIVPLSAIVAVEGVATVFQIVHSSDPSQFTIGAQLSEPLGYSNATAALTMIMVFLSLGLASRPWVPVPVRAVAFGLAGLNLTLDFFCDSRGSVFTLPGVVVAYLVLIPNRLRSLAALGVVALGTLPVVTPVFHVFNVAPADYQHAVRHAIYVGLLWAVILACAGGLFAALDNRIAFSLTALRRIRLAVIGAFVVALVVLSAALHPWHVAQTSWHSFKYSQEPTGAISHFGGLGSNRYDFWRVGLIEFRKHPVQGIGVDNFLVPYLEQRRSVEEPAYPHSLFIRLLSQTGLVGTALFVAFLGLVVAVVVRIPAGRERELAGIFTVGASVWLLHGLVDWLWEMPVLSIIGMALLGAACSLAPRRAASSARGMWRIPLLMGGVAAAAVAAASFAFPWIAQREVQQAAANWPNDANAAFAVLQRAHELNPLNDQADLVAGAIASRLHRYPLMRERFQAAVSRSPDDWYANLELGIAASLTGGHDVAAASLQRAVQLNPGEPIVRQVVRDFNAGHRIDSDTIDQEFQAPS